MRIINKSPAVYVYECEKCSTQFNTEVEARTCEASHAEVLGFTSKKYVYQSKYPTSVSVRMKDNSIQTYAFTTEAADDILENMTTDGRGVIAIVNAYDVVVQKEYVKDEQLIIEKLSGVSIKLDNRKLIVSIPDEIQVLSTDTICVKVTNENGDEVTTESENTIFDEIIISAEIRTVVDNDCKE